MGDRGNITYSFVIYYDNIALYCMLISIIVADTGFRVICPSSADQLTLKVVE